MANILWGSWFPAVTTGAENHHVRSTQRGEIKELRQEPPNETRYFPCMRRVRPDRRTFPV